MFKIAKLKIVKRYRLAVPNNIRLSFYIFPIGDQTYNDELTDEDIDIIKKIDIYNINSLVDVVEYVDKGDLYSLMVEGAIQGCATGADLGIYDYNLNFDNKDKTIDISKFIGDKFVNNIDDEDVISYTKGQTFANCILAEPNSNGSEYSKVVKTFKGYLQVTLDEFSFIRSSDCCSDLSIVYVPQYYVRKYQLRNGDELVCTCKEDKGYMVLSSLFAINKVSCADWDNSRPWFNNLKQNNAESLKSTNDFMQEVIHKFNLYKGDNMFLYLSKTCQKQKILPKLIDELEYMFDYIVYLNPKYLSVPYIDKCYKIAKFCTPINAELKHQQNMILLGANYAKRLVELGNKVAVIVDDAEAIMELETEIALPICKTVYSCSISGKDAYSNSFTLVSLKNRLMKNIKFNKILKFAETIGIMFDNNEIDTFNSYRV